jgi:hypothetical protein
MTALYPSVLKLPHVDQPSDGELTRTLEDQQDTEDVLAEVLYEVQANANPEAEYLKLAKLQHIQYMAANFGKLSAGFVALDASRPWLAF